MSVQLATANISLNTASVTRQGFSTILFSAEHNTFLERVQTYTSLTSVTDAGFATDSKVYKAAQGAFGQSPRPAQFKVGRIQSDTHLIVSDASEGKELSFKIKGGDVDVTISHTIVSGTAGNTASTAAAFKADIDTAMGSGQPLEGLSGRLTTEVSGSSVILKPSGLGVAITGVTNLTENSSATEGAAAALAGITGYDDDFYYYTSAIKDRQWILDSAADINARFKFYRVSTSDASSYAANLLDGDGGLGIVGQILEKQYGNVFIEYHDQADTEFPEVAALAEVATWTTGSVDFHARIVEGVRRSYNKDGNPLTDSQVAAMIKNKVNFFDRVKISGTAGTNPSITYGGLTASGELALNIVARDNMKIDLEAAMTNFQISQKSGRLAFDDDTIINIVATASTILSSYAKTGIGNHNFILPDFQIFYPEAKDISAADKASHVFDHITFEANLRGGIHLLKITGSLGL